MIKFLGRNRYFLALSDICLKLLFLFIFCMFQSFVNNMAVFKHEKVENPFFFDLKHVLRSHVFN